MKDANGQMVATDIVLGELAGKWDTLSDAQKNAFIQDGAGIHRRNQFLVLMENWNDVMANTDAAMNSQGVAAEKNAIFMDSYQGSVNKFKNEMEKLYISVLSPDNLKAWVDLGTNITEFVNTLGLGNIALLAFGATMGTVLFKGLPSIVGFVELLSMAFAGLTTGTLSLNNAFIALGVSAKTLSMIPLVAVITAVAGAFVYAQIEAQKFVDTQKQATESSNNLTKAYYENKESAESQLKSLSDLVDVKKLSVEQDGRIREVTLQLQKLYPDLLGNISKEKKGLQGLVDAYNAVSKAALQSQIARLASESIAIESELNKTYASRGPQGLAVDSGQLAPQDDAKTKAIKDRLRKNQSDLAKATRESINFKGITVADLKNKDTGTIPSFPTSPSGTTRSTPAATEIAPEKLAKERYFALNEQLAKNNILLEKNRALQENTTSIENKNKLYELEIGLLKERQKLLEKTNIERGKEAKELQQSLTGQGIKFDKSGVAQNYESVINKMIDNINAHRTDKDKTTYNQLKKNLDSLQKDYDRFYKLQIEEIPRASIEWQKLAGEIGKLRENQLKEAIEKHKEHLKVVETLRTAIEDMVKQDLKNQIDAQKKLIEIAKQELDIRLKQIDAEKDLADFNKDRLKREKDISKLTNKISELRTASSQGDAKATNLLLELEEERAKSQEELNETINDRTVEQTKERLNSEYELYEKNANKEIDLLQGKLDNASYIAKRTNDEINAYLSGSSSTLYQNLINWNKQYGTGMDSDIISKWETAISLIEKYNSTLGKSGGFTFNDFAGSNPSQTGALSKSSVISQMQANGAMWASASKEQRAKLNEQNKALASQIGYKLFDVDGKYYPESYSNETLSTMGKAGRDKIKLYDNGGLKPLGEVGVLGKNVKEWVFDDAQLKAVQTMAIRDYTSMVQPNINNSASSNKVDINIYGNIDDKNINRISSELKNIVTQVSQGQLDSFRQRGIKPPTRIR